MSPSGSPNGEEHRSAHYEGIPVRRGLPAGSRLTRWLAGALLALSSVARAADDAGCERLQLALDPQLTAAFIEQHWASGEDQAGAAAVLELRGCAGELLDRLALPAPWARLDPVPLRGAPRPTYLVSVDLTAPAGSYNGPLTMPVQLSRHRLQRVEAKAPDGRAEPIALAETGKAAWKKHPVGGVEDLLSISSHHEEEVFVTVYRRYHPTRHGWTVRVRSELGLWESDQDFPETKRFR